MSEVEAFENFEEAAPAQVFDQAPVVQPAELPDIKLFGRWSSDDIHISDISVSDYIAVKEKHAKYLPHSAGRYAAKRFRKAQCPIVERLTNSLMMKGRNNGKKLKAVRIVRHAFEIMHLLTGENPLQIVVQAIINSGPREDSTRIGRAGTVRRQAVDVSPLRRVNQVGFRARNVLRDYLATDSIQAYWVGRVKPHVHLQFHWDRKLTSKLDGGSCWVPLP